MGHHFSEISMLILKTTVLFVITADTFVSYSVGKLLGIAWLTGLEHRLMVQKVPGSIPGRVSCCGLIRN